MPVYEFRCDACSKKLSFLVRGGGPALVCPSCGSQDMRRLISACAYHRSGQLGGSVSSGPDYYQDPGNIGRWAEKRLEEAGVEVPPHLRNMIDRARDGDLPEPLKDS
ncbi:MAG: zinc ribbon domain-containing protein [Chloroflexi bacterium]|nr:zinc ribbon domain-containing protein [Chloroflexota bacterium]